MTITSCAPVRAFKKARHEARHRSTSEPGEDAQRHVDDGRRVDLETDVARRHRPGDQLALAADVEHARAEPKPDGESRDAERRGVEQRLADRRERLGPSLPGVDRVADHERVAERTGEQVAIRIADGEERHAHRRPGVAEQPRPGVEHVGLGDDDEDRADEQTAEDRECRHHDDVRLDHPMKEPAPAERGARRRGGGGRSRDTPEGDRGVAHLSVPDVVPAGGTDPAPSPVIPAIRRPILSRPTVGSTVSMIRPR